MAVDTEECPPSSGPMGRGLGYPLGPESTKSEASFPGYPRPASAIVSSVNFRDLATVSKLIKPGRVYRSSQVISAADTQKLDIKAFVDLRETPVLCRADVHNASARFRHVWRRVRQTVCRTPSPPPEANSAPPCARCSALSRRTYGHQAQVFHVDLIPAAVGLRVLWELPRTLKLQVVVAVLRKRRPDLLVAGAVADPGVLGYLKFYLFVLEHAKPQLARALRLFGHRASPPLLLHCIHGKDRTGLVCMLLLKLCGVSDEAIVRDYVRSELRLRTSRERSELSDLEPRLVTDAVIAAAAHVAVGTLDYLRQSYGSVYAYTRRIGLQPHELADIRGALMGRADARSLGEASAPGEEEELLAPEHEHDVCQASDGIPLARVAAAVADAQRTLSMITPDTAERLGQGPGGLERLTTAVQRLASAQPRAGHKFSPGQVMEEEEDGGEGEMGARSSFSRPSSPVCGSAHDQDDRKLRPWQSLPVDFEEGAPAAPWPRRSATRFVPKSPLRWASDGAPRERRAAIASPRAPLPHSPFEEHRAGDRGSISPRRVPLQRVSSGEEEGEGEGEPPTRLTPALDGEGRGEPQTRLKLTLDGGASGSVPASSEHEAP